MHCSKNAAQFDIALDHQHILGAVLFGGNRGGQSARTAADDDHIVFLL